MGGICYAQGLVIGFFERELIEISHGEYFAKRCGLSVGFGGRCTVGGFAGLRE